MNACTLDIDLRTYWHPGTGRGAGSVLDAVTHRDSHGLPVLPGRHVKGLLRDALECAEDFKWDGYEGLASQLFGDRPEQTTHRLPLPGCLRVSDATLPPELATWLTTSDEGKAMVPHLYRHVFATAVEHDSGTAKDKSLRGVEVVVPLKLRARIEPVPGCGAPTGWPVKLREVLPLIDAVGAQRSRGLGRAVLTLEETL